MHGAAVWITHAAGLGLLMVPSVAWARLHRLFLPLFTGHLHAHLLSYLAQFSSKKYEVGLQQASTRKACIIGYFERDLFCT